MNVERADIVGRACAVRSVFYFVLASLSGRRSMKKWVRRPPTCVSREFCLEYCPIIVSD